VFMTDVRLFLKARDLFVEVVRTDEKGEQGHYCAAFFGGIEGHVFLLLDSFFRGI